MPERKETMVPSIFNSIESIDCHTKEKNSLFSFSFLRRLKIKAQEIYIYYVLDCIKYRDEIYFIKVVKTSNLNSGIYDGEYNEIGEKETK